ncbi:unnamed protein product [Rotaria sp. Silwood1]|nr:unnamed protein product [Rotaria sp. Silwood1]
MGATYWYTEHGDTVPRVNIKAFSPSVVAAGCVARLSDWTGPWKNFGNRMKPGDEVQLGSTRPPLLFEDQPTLIIFDLNGYFANPRIDLKPFHNIVNIIHSENGLHHELDDPNRSFTTVIILPQWNHCKVPLFVQQNVLQYSSVRFICLFFINGQATDMKAIYGTKLIGCYSITSRISTQTRTVCAKTNDLNIDYCQQHRLQNEVRGDIGVANLYARQIFERVDLQIAYNEQLQKEIEQQLFG